MSDLNCNKNAFIDAFQSKQVEIHTVAKSKGWWDQDRNDSECIMLVVTELAEAVEALRHDNPKDDKIPEFSGLEAELADAVIRIMDYSEARGLRLAEAILAKTEMNKTRQHKHGKKF